MCWCKPCSVSVSIAQVRFGGVWACVLFGQCVVMFCWCLSDLNPFTSLRNSLKSFCTRFIMLVSGFV